MVDREMETLGARKKLKDRLGLDKVRRTKKAKKNLSHCSRSSENCPQLWNDFPISQEEQQARFQRKDSVKMHRQLLK